MICHKFYKMTDRTVNRFERDFVSRLDDISAEYKSTSIEYWNIAIKVHEIIICPFMSLWHAK